MKKIPVIAFVMASFIVMSCKDDDLIDPINPIGETKIYNLESVSDPNVFGTATFIRNEDNSTTVEIEIENAPANTNHPVYIRLNTALEGGGIAITLNPVDAKSGRGSTTLTQTDEGTPITYPDLMVFDGHLSLSLSADEPETVLLQADIGNNELTGESKIYPLDSLDVAGTSGTATFERRKSGEILATLLVSPTTDGEMYPAHIHNNNALEPGSPVLTFNPVDGTTGKSLTNINALDDGMALSFQDLLMFDGSVDVHLSETNLGTIMARGDMGQNELTGEIESYLLDPVSDPNISGDVTFAARINRETLVTVILQGTTAGNFHPAHIHNGSVESPGNIAVTLNDVIGETGIGKTNVTALDNGDSLSYDQLILHEGYLDVHQSSTDLSIIIAEGNIGASDE